MKNSTGLVSLFVNQPQVISLFVPPEAAFVCTAVWLLSRDVQAVAHRE